MRAELLSFCIACERSWTGLEKNGLMNLDLKKIDLFELAQENQSVYNLL
jgi:hypothetical protein